MSYTYIRTLILTCSAPFRNMACQFFFCSRVSPMWQDLKKATRIAPNQWFDENGVLVIPQGHKMSSHLDLFYDLVFVVALASMGKTFRHKAHEGGYEFETTMHAVFDMSAMLVPVLLNHLFLHAYSNR